MMQRKKILEVFNLKSSIVGVKGPHGESVSLNGPLTLIKLYTPFPESLEHSYYLDVKSLMMVDLFDFEDWLELVREDYI